MPYDNYIRALTYGDICYELRLWLWLDLSTANTFNVWPNQWIWCDFFGNSNVNCRVRHFFWRFSIGDKPNCSTFRIMDHRYESLGHMFHSRRKILVKNLEQTIERHQEWRRLTFVALLLSYPIATLFHELAIWNDSHVTKMKLHNPIVRDTRQWHVRRSNCSDKHPIHSRMKDAMKIRSRNDYLNFGNLEKRRVYLTPHDRDNPKTACLVAV